jgi:hypothetical protein
LCAGGRFVRWRAASSSTCIGFSRAAGMPRQARTGR